jgi:hypothetical protein
LIPTTAGGGSRRKTPSWLSPATSPLNAAMKPVAAVSTPEIDLYQGCLGSSATEAPFDRVLPN